MSSSCFWSASSNSHDNTLYFRGLLRVRVVIPDAVSSFRNNIPPSALVDMVLSSTGTSPYVAGNDNSASRLRSHLKTLPMQRLIMTEKNVDETEEYGGDATLVPMSSVPHIIYLGSFRGGDVLFTRGPHSPRDGQDYRFLRWEIRVRCLHPHVCTILSFIPTIPMNSIEIWKSEFGLSSPKRPTPPCFLFTFFISQIHESSKHKNSFLFRSDT